MELQSTLQVAPATGLADPYLLVVLLIIVATGILGGLANSFLAERPQRAAPERSKYVLLGVVAVFLMIEMHSLLIGEGATVTEDRAIRAALTQTANVIGVSDLRTQYLGPDERPRAAVIHQVLQAMRQAQLEGAPRDALEAQACAQLQAAGFVVDYAVLRRPDLTEPDDGEPGPKVALVAARLGTTRLIDNLEF